MEPAPTDGIQPPDQVQAGGRRGCHAHHLPACSHARQLPALLVACVLAAGCTKRPADNNPVTWWHELEGGAIAQQRPPPPGADEPYPSLSTVPAKPTPTDPTTRARVASALLQDRNNAQYLAAQSPITAPPRAALVPKPAPAAPDASSASLEATQAPPPKPIAAAAPVAAPASNLLTIPEAPPGPPVFAGLQIGPTVPVPPPKAPPAPKPVQSLSEAARAPVQVAFAPGSAVLPPGTDGALKQLAARRAGAGIDIIGFGEASDTQPQLQTAGITLALQRAHAVSAALTAAGVPAAAMRIEAQAEGRGADARLVE